MLELKTNATSHLLAFVNIFQKLMKNVRLHEKNHEILSRMNITHRPSDKVKLVESKERGKKPLRIREYFIFKGVIIRLMADF